MLGSFPLLTFELATEIERLKMNKTKRVLIISQPSILYVWYTLLVLFKTAWVSRASKFPFLNGHKVQLTKLEN